MYSLYHRGRSITCATAEAVLALVTAIETAETTEHRITVDPVNGPGSVIEPVTMIRDGEDVPPVEPIVQPVREQSKAIGGHGRYVNRIGSREGKSADDVYACIQEHGPQRPKEIIARFPELPRWIVDCWLAELVSDGRLQTSGNTQRKKVWIEGQTVKDWKDIRREKINQPLSISQIALERLQEETLFQAERYGHKMQAFHACSSKAVSATVAHCSACRGYVTIGKSGEVNWHRLMGECRVHGLRMAG